MALPPLFRSEFPGARMAWASPQRFSILSSELPDNHLRIATKPVDSVPDLGARQKSVSLFGSHGRGRDRRPKNTCPLVLCARDRDCFGRAWVLQGFPGSAEAHFLRIC